MEPDTQIFDGGDPDTLLSITAALNPLIRRLGHRLNKPVRVQKLQIFDNGSYGVVALVELNDRQAAQHLCRPALRFAGRVVG